MEYKDLDELLEKFYNGTSSKEDEMEILRLLGKQELSGKYTEEAMLFASVNDDDIPEPDQGFESRIMAGIDDYEKEKEISSLRRRIYLLTSAAAALLILISTWIIAGNNILKDTYEDPVLAYNETREILRMVSDGINTGRDKLGDLSILDKAGESMSLIHESRDLVNNELEPLKMISRSLNLLGTETNDNNK
jgi:hypothetical protein